MRRSWLLFPLLICLSGCPPEKAKPDSDKTLKDVLEAPPTADAATIEKHARENAKAGPLVLKARTIGQMRDPATLSRYVCGAVESHIQDRLILSKQYSAEFMTATLKELPVSLQQTYATCFVEKEVKSLGFEKYFREERGYLAPEAVKGFETLGAAAHLKLLKRALELGYQDPKTPQEEARISKMLAGLDELWKELDRKPMLRQRADFMRARIDAGEWKTK